MSISTLKKYCDPIATRVSIIIAIAGAMILVENPNPVMPSPPSASVRSENQRQSRPRQVSRFEDKFGVVAPYCGRFDFELDPDFNYRDNSDYEDEEDSNHVPNPRARRLSDTSLKSERASYGFDVDCVPPSWFNGPFVYVDMQTESEDPEFCDYLKKVVDYAVAEISAETGKNYELVKVEKVVIANFFMLFSTIRVKEVAVDGRVVEEKTIQAIAREKMYAKRLKLYQWRYKPEEEDVWFEPPPLNPVGPQPPSESESI